VKATQAFAILACAYAAWLPPASLAASEIGPDATPPESRIPVGGADLYSREIGQGTPIIVLHGGPDFDHSYLIPDLDRLSDSFRLIYYDQRGRGRSADHISRASMARDLRMPSFANARLVTLKDCGHFTYLECPVAVREQIDAFFRAK
jgi:pimeloyl-ACP methyl ester carboxylesterase